MHSTRLQQQGFTLLELMVTLAIVAIVTAIALPSMRGIIGGSEISATSNHFVYSLQSARSEAIKRTSTVGLCPSIDPQAAIPVCGGNYTQGWIVFVDTDGNGKRNGTDPVVLRSEALSPAFTVTPDSLFSKRVLFSLSGTSVNTAGVPISGSIAISHSAQTQKRNIKIAASGRITTSNPDSAEQTKSGGLHTSAELQESGDSE